MADAMKIPEMDFIEEVKLCTNDYFTESDRQKMHRKPLNKSNWDAFNLVGDFSHKIKGQSTEYLPKVWLATEQIVALIKSTITNFDKWFDVEWVGEQQPDPIFSTESVKKILALYLQWADIKVVLSDGLKVGLHEGTVTAKVGGDFVNVPRYVTQKRQVDGGAKIIELKRAPGRDWRLLVSILPFEDYFPDPYANGGPKLYEIHQVVSDHFKVMEKAGKDGIYEIEDPDALASMEPDTETRKAENRKEEPHHSRTSRRKPHIIWECWGTMLDRNGNIMRDPDGVQLRNVVWTLANKGMVIRKPKPNPRWANCSPIITAPILRTPFATWSKAVMDATTSLNVSLNELFNLMLDAGLMAVHGIKQIRVDWLEDTSDVSKGIAPGVTLRANLQCPPGMKVLERVDTGNVPGDVLAFYNIMDGLTAEASMSNQLRMSGQLPSKQVRATEAVIANQTITGVFDGIAKDFEDQFVEKLIEQSWLEILQNVEKFPEDDMIRIMGKEKAGALQKMSRQERFKRAASGFKFVAKGASALLNRTKDFQRLAQFLSVIGANPQLLELFSSEYSMPRLIKHLLSSLEIDPDKIGLTDQEVERRRAMEEERNRILARAEAENASGGDSSGGPAGRGRDADLLQEGQGPQVEGGAPVGNNAEFRS